MRKLHRDNQHGIMSILLAAVLVPVLIILIGLAVQATQVMRTQTALRKEVELFCRDLASEQGLSPTETEAAVKSPNTAARFSAVPGIKSGTSIQIRVFHPEVFGEQIPVFPISESSHWPSTTAQPICTDGNCHQRQFYEGAPSADPFNPSKIASPNSYPNIESFFGKHGERLGATVACEVVAETKKFLPEALVRLVGGDFQLFDSFRKVSARAVVTLSPRLPLLAGSSKEPGDLIIAIAPGMDVPDPSLTVSSVTGLMSQDAATDHLRTTAQRITGGVQGCRTEQGTPDPTCFKAGLPNSTSDPGSNFPTFSKFVDSLTDSERAFVARNCVNAPTIVRNLMVQSLLEPVVRHGYFRQHTGLYMLGMPSSNPSNPTLTSFFDGATLKPRDILLERAATPFMQSIWAENSDLKHVRQSSILRACNHLYLARFGDDGYFAGPAMQRFVPPDFESGAESIFPPTDVGLPTSDYFALTNALPTPRDDRLGVFEPRLSLSPSMLDGDLPAARSVVGMLGSIPLCPDAPSDFHDRGLCADSAGTEKYQNAVKDFITNIMNGSLSYYDKAGEPGSSITRTQTLPENSTILLFTHRAPPSGASSSLTCSNPRNIKLIVIGIPTSPTERNGMEEWRKLMETSSENPDPILGCLNPTLRIYSPDLDTPAGFAEYFAFLLSPTWKEKENSMYIPRNIKEFFYRQILQTDVLL